MASERPETGREISTAPWPRSLRLGLIAYAAALAGALAVLLMVPYSGDFGTNVWLARHQDLWLLVAQFEIAALCALPVFATARIRGLSARQVAVLAAAVAAVCYAGHFAVLEAQDVLRDEQMATFDAYVFANGRLVWPIPPHWRAEAAALSLDFMAPVQHPVAWISLYLPGNAALRALVAQVADPALTGPLLGAATVARVWSCARKIWPGQPAVAAVCTALTIGSGQVLFNAMSAFAMPLHLCLNLLWLRLWLADRRRADLAAIAVGALATGAHQPLFHPLFAAPFLLLTLHDGQKGRFALFGSAYLVIGLFWLNWPHAMTSLVTGPGSITAPRGVGYATRLLDTIAGNHDNLLMMLENLLRFCTWQNVLTVPLMLVGLAGLRGNRLAQALALGAALPVAVMAVILPWQGNGFGYRYLHPALGNVILLAGFGWSALSRRVTGIEPILLRATAGTLALALPLQMVLTHSVTRVFASASRAIDAAPADYFLIDPEAGIAAASLVINRPDLGNRPIRLNQARVADPARLGATICPGGRIAAFGSARFYNRINRRYDSELLDEPALYRTALTAALVRAGCRIRVVD